MSAPSIFFGTIDSGIEEANVVAEYKLLSGNTPNPGNPEYPILMTIAYCRVLAKMDIERAGRAGIIAPADANGAYATGANLDYAAGIIGLKRLPSSPALTTIQFILPIGHGNVVIPTGTAIASVDGQVVFTTIEDINVPAFTSGSTTINIIRQSIPGDALSSIAVGGVQLLASGFVFTGAATAEIQIANAINANTANSGYSAVAGTGSLLLIAPLQAGATLNGITPSMTTSGLVSLATSPIAGGVTGLNIVTATVQCTADGVIGNGYSIGTLTVIQNPQPFLLSATNTAPTTGGADIETDVAFTARWIPALEALSVAGPGGAYKFFALSADPSIISVSVIGPEDNMGVKPGNVEIRVLTNSEATTTQAILQLVYNACNPNKVRPLCDTVNVYSAEIITYSLNIGITAFVGADVSAIPALVQAAVQSYATTQGQNIGYDIILDSIKSAYMSVTGVKEGNLNGFVDIPVDLRTVAICTGITVTVTSTQTE